MFYCFAPETNKLSTFWSCTPKKNESPKLASWFSGFSVFGNFTTTTLTPLSLNICIFTSPSFTFLARSMLLTDDVFGHRFSMLFGHGHLMFVHAVWRSDLTIRNYQSHHPPFSHPLTALLQLLLDFVVKSVWLYSRTRWSLHHSSRYRFLVFCNFATYHAFPRPNWFDNSELSISSSTVFSSVTALLQLLLDFVV